MKFSYKVVLIISILCYFVSCRETIGEERNTSPQKSEIPDEESREVEKSIEKTESPNPVESPNNKDVKKKKKKVTDTLKPVTAIP